MPCMLLSPSWCLMHESPAHLFMHCPFASCLWHIILEAFGWSPPCRNITFDLLDLLASLLVGHPFGGTKKTLWLPSCGVLLDLVEQNGLLLDLVGHVWE